MLDLLTKLLGSPSKLVGARGLELSPVFRCGGTRGAFLGRDYRRISMEDIAFLPSNCSSMALFFTSTGNAHSSVTMLAWKR